MSEAPARATLLDVEGVTTAIDFVHLVLFPFARDRVEEHLGRAAAGGAAHDEVDALRAERERDAADGQDVPPWPEGSADERARSAAAYVRFLIDQDRKSTPLKSLQGQIWERGYRDGRLRGHVYPDVAPALARWRGEGRCVAIFSSGSVLSQRLLFEHSDAGDLTPWIDAYFDTTTGPKRDAASYREIARRLGIDPASIRFVSDVRDELDAAAAAGLRTALCVRSGAAPDAARAEPHPVVRGLDDPRL